MSVVKITQIGSVRPSVHPRALANDDAQAVRNLLARTNEFRPLGTDVQVATSAVANPQLIYRMPRKADGSLNSDMSQGWITRGHVINYARGQLDDNTTERTYYTLADGSEPPKVMDVTGQDRLLGVPAMTTPPVAQVQTVYSFTEEQKRIEKVQAQQLVVQMAEAHAQPALVGPVFGGSVWTISRLADQNGPIIGENPLTGTLPAGWLLESNVNPSDESRCILLRVFALDPSTKQIISTYSDMPAGEATWVLDPALGGRYADRPAGVTLPSWANGHSAWWVIPLRAYARAYTLDAAGLATALQTIDMPGTQGAAKYLSAAEAATLAERLDARFDASGPAFSGARDALLERLRQAGAMFNQGGATALKKATTDFYARADIAASIESAKTAFAETIWRYAEMIGSSTATPWYQDSGGGA